MSGIVQGLREVREGIARRFPAWRIWYVRRLHGDPQWFAQQGTQLLDEQSPGRLTDTIEDIERSRTMRRGGPA